MSKTDLKEIIYRLHPLERKVLASLHFKSLEEISQKSKLSEAEVTMGLQLLEQRGFVTINRSEEVFVALDKFGIKYVDTDLPEIKLLKEIADASKKMSELKLDPSEIGSALGILKRNDLIDIKKDKEQVFSARSKAKEFIKKHRNPLKLFSKGVSEKSMTSEQKKVLDEFRRRPGFLKFVRQKKFGFKLSDVGIKLAQKISKEYSNLELLEAVDSEMLKNGTWKGKEFRHYEIGLEASVDSIGRKHPMLEANGILRDVFVEMGFQEMIGPIVESAFWNMDTMWIPQDHPARDEQDTFYLEGQADIPEDLAKKVKKMHEVGIKGSHTEIGEWSEETAKKRLLRTHSTATTFRTLAKLGEDLKKGKDINGKYFYIAHDFRNETIDATHLAEFFQGEGFIVGDDLSLADLMGFIKEYYAKLGIDQVRFKPTFNPYTEPSMEAHYYDPKMKKWYSLINSGIFRQETLEPLGLGGKTVIAWGMGASRVATLLARSDSMRDITGNTCDFDFLKNRPMMTRRIVR